MKEHLDDETRAAMVTYRMERARQTLNEAIIILKLRLITV